MLCVSYCAWEKWQFQRLIQNPRYFGEKCNFSAILTFGRNLLYTAIFIFSESSFFLLSCNRFPVQHSETFSSELSQLTIRLEKYVGATYSLQYISNIKDNSLRWLFYTAKTKGFSKSSSTVDVHSDVLGQVGSLEWGKILEFARIFEPKSDFTDVFFAEEKITPLRIINIPKLHPPQIVSVRMYDSGISIIRKARNKRCCFGRQSRLCWFLSFTLATIPLYLQLPRTLYFEMMKRRIDESAGKSVTKKKSEHDTISDPIQKTRPFTFD